MRPPYVTSELLNDFIDRAFQEDLGDGDHSTLASIPADAEKSAYLLMKESGVIAGMDLAPLIFHKLDPNMTIEPLAKDGNADRHCTEATRVRG